VLKAAPIARNGYRQYTHINQVWNMDVPMMPDDKISSSVLAGSFAGLTLGDSKKDEKGGDGRDDDAKESKPGNVASVWIQGSWWSTMTSLMFN
jgi:hypothetical protein